MGAPINVGMTTTVAFLGGGAKEAEDLLEVQQSKTASYPYCQAKVSSNWPVLTDAGFAEDPPVLILVRTDIAGSLSTCVYTYARATPGGEQVANEPIPSPEARL